MASSRLAALKSTQLKYIAFLTGLPSTGTKSHMLTTIGAHLVPRPSCTTGKRIVSVDMGIKNLAYCVVDVPAVSTEALRVKQWKRTDLLSPTARNKDIDDSSLSSISGAIDGLQQSPPDQGSKVGAFAPRMLAGTAYSVVQELLSAQPTTILIEQQRFRSGGAPAIQEWTVRVNMLESMLWACLYTMKQSSTLPSQAFPDIHSVSPAKVASFWTAAPQLSLHATEDVLESLQPQESHHEKRPRAKVDKKDKINIVRSWLEGKDAQVSLSFEDDAAKVAKAVARQPSRRKDDATSAARAFGKVDDLADCLLQAAAWARWEANRDALSRMLAEGS